MGHHWTYWLSGLAILGGLLAVEPVQGQARTSAVPHTVLDTAQLFSDAAREEANRRLAEIKSRTGKDLVIETLSELKGVPEDKQERSRFFEKVVQERASNFGVEGVYVLICRKPGYVQVGVGEATRREGWFSNAQRKELRDILLKNLKEKKYDEALREGVNYVQRVLEAHRSAVGPVTQSNPKVTATPRPVQGEETGAPSWLGWVCLGLAALLVLWLIIGVIRAVTGGASPGPGYGRPVVAGGAGYGGPPVYGGGGGGGFFSSLLGGLFGAAAGMWLYNHFFGGGTPVAHGGAAPAAGAAGAAAGAASGAETAASDVGGQYSSEGGEWDTGGEEAGGGQASGEDWDAGGDEGDTGGGDWDAGNSGGDAGGGGDWGGGDAGGGGDWGGGGGDFGGGGGDW